MVFTVTTFTTEIQIVNIAIKNTGPILLKKVSLANLLDSVRTIMVMQAYSKLGSWPPKKMLLGYGVGLAKRIFKGYREEHRMIKLEDLISLSEIKTVSGRFSIDWTSTFEGTKLPYRKQGCIDCDNKKVCCNCGMEP